MASELDKDYHMKVYQKGQVVIPIDLRRRYGINVGDQIDAVPTRDGILIKPGSGGELSNADTDQLYGVFANYKPKRSRQPGKKEIAKATESGFSDGWPK